MRGLFYHENVVFWLKKESHDFVKQTFLLPFLGLFSVTIVCTEDSESLSLAGDYFLSVSPEHLKLYKKDEVRNLRIQWHLEDIPRFRLQRLCHLHDGEKIFIINVAR